MNRLNKELRQRGIVYDADEVAIVMKGAEYDTDTRLVSIENGIITILWSSAVMDSVFKLYDLQFNLIGEQSVHPDKTFNGSRTWYSSADEFKTVNGVNYLDRFGKYQLVYYDATELYYLVDMVKQEVLVSGEYDECFSAYLDIMNAIRGVA